MNVIIFYPKIFNLDDDDIFSSIGGVQRYLFELGNLFSKKFNFEKIIFVQFGDCEKTVKTNEFSILQLQKISLKKMISLLKNRNLLNNDDLFIWGSDTFSLKLNQNIKSIAIQHGIACDGFPLETKKQKIIYNIKPIAILYKFLQLFKSYYVFEKSLYRVCVDYNYINWYRTIDIYRKTIENIFVIPNFTQIPLKKIRENNNKITISFARRFHYNRGVKLMVNVAKRLLTKYDCLEFVFAGEGDEIKYVNELIHSYPSCVRHLKFKPSETFEYHQKVDIAVVPTIAAEGTSLSLLEAMASSCAVVCSNVGGMSNIVIDEFNGLCINPCENELYDALEKLINNYDLRVKLGNNAYETAKSGFSLEIWQKKWISVIDKIMKSERVL